MLRMMGFALCVLVIAGSPAAHAQGSESEWRRALEAARYMSNGADCQPATTPMLGWPASALTRCVYQLRDTAGAKARKTGLVYLANAPPDRILTWLRTACRRTSPAAVERCVGAGVDAVLGASGAQFAVSGLVWEDMDRDGINNGYVFRNGVTVRISEFANNSSQAADRALLEIIANPATPVRGVKSWGGYARIMSTTREEFARFTGRRDVPLNRADAAAAIAWSGMVGEAYRAALAADENPLVSAKICATANWPSGCTPSR